MRKIFITGGAGFIGSNAADIFASKGDRVTVFDNFSRKGTRANAAWLKEKHPDVQIVEGDIRDLSALKEAMQGHDTVLHLAAQVAVTTSVVDPREDFEINALGAFNVLEAARSMEVPPALLYSSTNKVYGGMEDVSVVERDGRYEYEDLRGGASESRQLDFHSPYGCSKGCADQYFVDYARIYGLKTVVFRQSCIYGRRQFGVEDQGWVAWFSIATLLGRPLTIFGDGKQVRDVLFVDDLVEAYDMALSQIDKISGQAFNIGGGPSNTLSLLELLAFLEKEFGMEIPREFDEWRPGDQKVFVCDVSKAEREFGWRPSTSPEEGVKKLIDWIKENRSTLEEYLVAKREHQNLKNEQTKAEQKVV
ncbi:GDP-mannose 4,6-dehydratase [Patescibacteria group bacterium]|nr:GDP-mannose 4,6-dehydratase [Patescibacteria group bacterium]